MGRRRRKEKEDCRWYDPLRGICLIDELPCVLDDGVTEDCEEYGEEE